MDFIAELLFSIIAEASIELPNPKTPLPFKIIASIIVFVCSALFLWAGVHLFRRMFGNRKEK